MMSCCLLSHSVVSDTLWPHGLQHTRLPCPLCPGVCSNSRPLGRWCHPTISSSVAPFSSHPQSFPASGSFPMSWMISWRSQNCDSSGIFGRSGELLGHGGGGWCKTERIPKRNTGFVSFMVVVEHFLNLEWWQSHVNLRHEVETRWQWAPITRQALPEVDTANSTPDKRQKPTWHLDRSLFSLGEEKKRMELN